MILRRSSVLLRIGSNHLSLFLDYMHFLIERQSLISIILALLIILYAQMQIEVEKNCARTVICHSGISTTAGFA